MLTGINATEKTERKKKRRKKKKKKRLTGHDEHQAKWKEMMASLNPNGILKSKTVLEFTTPLTLNVASLIGDKCQKQSQTEVTDTNCCNSSHMSPSGWGQASHLQLKGTPISATTNWQSAPHYNYHPVYNTLFAGVYQSVGRNFNNTDNFLSDSLEIKLPFSTDILCNTLLLLLKQMCFVTWNQTEIQTPNQTVKMVQVQKQKISTPWKDSPTPQNSCTYTYNINNQNHVWPCQW